MSEEVLKERKQGAAWFWRRFGVLTVVVVVFAALLGWLYLVQKDALKTVQETAASERVKLEEQAEARHAATVKRSLGLVGVPLAWAVRREMLAGNLDQVDQYVGELVRLDAVQEVVVANAEGVIVVASDRRHAGAAFPSLFPERYLQADEVVVDETAKGRWLLVIPVMGLSARLGTMVVSYQPSPFSVGD